MGITQKRGNKMKVYTAGIIGYGGMAGNHEKVMRVDYDRMKLKGIFDINERRCDVAKEQGYYVYSSREEMLSDPEIDVVIIAATNDVHKEIAIDALKAGKSVICEKPVTMTSDELNEVMAVAEESKGVFTVDQNRRTNKDFVLMMRSVESGKIGKPYLIESRVEGSRGMPGGWRCEKKLGGGMMLDWGVHLIDQVMYFIDEKVTEVYCKMFNVHYDEVEDNLKLILTFESGLVAQIEVSTNNYIKHPRWYVLGDEGTLQIDDWDCEGKIVRCLDKENIWGEEIAVTKAGPTKTMAPRIPETVQTFELSEPLDVVDNLTVVYNQLLDAVEGKAELTIKPEQTMRVMKVMEASFKSAQDGCALKVNI